MNTFVIVGYYTHGTFYEEMSKTLIESLERHNIPFYIEGVPNLGTWMKNTSFKPTFLKQMINKFEENIVYVDVDARFFKFPILFEELNNDPECNIAVHVFDRSCYRASAKGVEVLSGTIFMRNCEWVRTILDMWEDRCKHNSIWDQKALESVLGDRFTKLPGEYCKIVDKWSDRYKDPVIVHYQASRKVRQTSCGLPYK